MPFSSSPHSTPPGKTTLPRGLGAQTDVSMDDGATPDYFSEKGLVMRLTVRFGAYMCGRAM